MGSSSGTRFRVVSALVIVLFCFAAAVQWNDPDPLRWAVLYAAAAVVTGVVAWGRVGPAAPGVLGLVALAWAAALLPSAVGTSFPELFQTWKMMSPGMEVGRESLGLLIVAAWMFVLVQATRTRST